MKTFTLSLIFILISIEPALSSSVLPIGAVAECGAYAIVQYQTTHGFAGIVHKENTYALVAKSDSEANHLDIETNSEGAVLSATEITDYDKDTGAAFKYLKHKIVAMWGDFYLLSVNETGTQKKIICTKRP